MLRIIVQVIIRSSWLIEGIGSGEISDETNLGQMVNHTVNYIESLKSNSRYYLSAEFLGEETSFRLQPTPNDDITQITYFMMRRLSVEGRGPNHPA
mmetsp:Transcript_38991/g.59312  ORF Transcript_38991/g.59312 Transcript_38991/m.59312 type:complete len:96 (+) Transcript_38991:2067-2354(+)